MGKAWQPKGRDRSRLELQRRASKVVMEDGLEQRRAFWEQGRQLVLYFYHNVTGKSIQYSLLVSLNGFKIALKTLNL